MISAFARMKRIAASVAVALSLCLGVAWAAVTIAVTAHAQDKAQASAGPPLDVAVFVGSRADVCHDPGDVAAITRLATAEQSRINRTGGIHGRPLNLVFLDDRRDEAAAIANMRMAIDRPQMLAMIGMSSSNRAQLVFKAHGEDIGRSAIPYLSDISVNRIIAPYPNVFTTRSSQEAERIPVMVRFLKSIGFERPAFAGTDSVFSQSLGNGLAEALGAGALVADRRLTIKDGQIDATDMKAVATDLAAKQPDVLIISVGSSRIGAMMEALKSAGATPALFMTGRIESIPPEIANAWPNAIYQLAWDRLPELDNERLRRRIAEEPPAEWVFEGRKIAGAPGWAKGECEDRVPAAVPDPFTSANLRAVALGTQYADMVGLIAAAGRAAPRDANLDALRRQIRQDLVTTYAAGRGAYKGSFENWSFDPKSRAASRTPFVVILPHTLKRTQLAPVQYVRLRDGSLKEIETLYADVDLIKAHRIDDNEQTFFAEFYLSIRNNPGADIARVEFANAYLDPRTNGRQITIEVVHDGKPNPAYPDSMKIYKVSGRFIFDPQLSSYPFDTQRFSIDLQPKRGDASFIVQPPPVSLRDRQLVTDGWVPKEQYVGYDEDFVSVIDAYTHVPSIVPYYKASYVWLMKRQTTDYFLRVIVPLAFILIVAYLSIFIPLSHFEAIVTIQVTALLSAVALYLSLPKLDSDTATLSDRLFVFDYMMVSLMIVISILMVNRRVSTRPWLKGALFTLHIVAIPALIGVMGWHVYTQYLAQQ